MEAERGQAVSACAISTRLLPIDLPEHVTSGRSRTHICCRSKCRFERWEKSVTATISERVRDRFHCRRRTPRNMKICAHGQSPTARDAPANGTKRPPDSGPLAFESGDETCLATALRGDGNDAIDARPRAKNRVVPEGGAIVRGSSVTSRAVASGRSATTAS